MRNRLLPLMHVFVLAVGDIKLPKVEAIKTIK
jgi:hypothetical protein